MSHGGLQGLLDRLGLRRRLGRASTRGRLIYAVGDVHGRYDLLQALLARIAEDVAATAGRRRPVLVLCGDYIDRGPQSGDVLEALLWLRRSDRFDLRLLRGNHEQAMLDFIANPTAGPVWLRNGGDATLAAYGLAPPDPAAGVSGLLAARERLLARLPASHLGLLQSLELTASVGDYLFVHAGVRPGVPLAAQSAADLLWIREEFLRAKGPFERFIVHGHSWTDDQPRLLPHRIGLDTGAFATGVLTAVRLDGTGVAVLQTAADRPWDPWAIRDRAGPQRPPGAAFEAAFAVCAATSPGGANTTAAMTRDVASGVTTNAGRA